MSETEQAPEPSARHLSEADVNERVAAFPIVGIGASAGGLEALTLFLTALPADTGMGFVIVQHLTPGRPSTLAEILARATPMPVCEVSDEAEVQPDHIYVIPPGRGMTIVGGRLQLFAQNREGRPSGIDQFFRALADDCRHKAIGVVLSGALSDGTLGLEEIKARGGIAFAQDETARHESMPRHAIASGCVDFVLSPGEIAAEIARIAHHSYVTPSGVGIPAAQLDHQRITQVLRRATGVDFTQYKSSMLQRRITRRMLLHKLEAHQDYEEMLRNSAHEVDALYQDLLIGVTSFFRDPDTYDTLKSVVFPKLLADRSADEPVRVWSLGCSTGEEAYSLAIAFAEAAEELESPAMLQLFASDLNAGATEKARTGLYPASIAQDVTPERLRRFFVEEKDGYRICKAIREQCIFARHNALADPPFSRMDLASCRNMLIYLEAGLQQQVLQTLHFSLKPGGWLWLGSSESVGEARALYDSVDAGHKLFTRRLGPPPSLRTYPTERWHFPSSPVSARDSPQGDLHRDSERVLAANDMQSLIEQHDATHEELQSSNEELQSLNEELETSKEEIQSTNEELTTVNDELNLRNRELHRLNDELRRARDYASNIVASVRVPLLVLDSALHVKTASLAFYETFQLTSAETIGQSIYDIGNGEWSFPELRNLLEVLLPREITVDHFEVSHTFDQIGSREMLLRACRLPQAAASRQLVVLSIEDITERSRAEKALQASEEYNRTIVESSRDCIKILDPEGTLLLITPTGQRLLCIDNVEDYIGKSWINLWGVEEHPTARRAVEAAAAGGTGSFVGQFFSGRDEPKWWDVRVTPIRNDVGIPDRLLVVSRDVSESRHREINLQLLAQMDQELSSKTGVHDIIRCVGEKIAPMLGLSSCVFVEINDAGGEVEVTHEWRRDEVPPTLGIHRLDDYFTQDFQTSSRAGETFVVNDTATDPRTTAEHFGALKIHAFLCVPLIREGVWRFTLSVHRSESHNWRHDEIDLTNELTPRIWAHLQRAHAMEALRDSEKRFRVMANAMSQLAWIARADGHIFWYNSRWHDYTGTTPEEMEGWGWQSVHDPETLPEVLEIWKAAISSGKLFEMTFPLRGADGQFRQFLTRAIPLTDESGKVLHWFGTNTDVSKILETEEELRRAHLKLQNVLASITDGLAIIDKEWHFTYFSEQGARMLGVRAEDMVGGSLLELFPQAAEGKFFAEFLRAVETRQPVHFADFYPEPINLWLECHCYPNDEGVSVYFQDVTERKQADEVLRQNAELVSRLVEQAPTGMYVVDSQFRLQQVNARALPIFENVNPLIDRDFAEVMEILWGAEVGGQCATIFRHTLDTGERYISPSFTEQRVDLGLEKAYEWETQRVTLHDGKYGVVCYFHDVTERHSQELAMRTMVENLAQAARSKDEFLAMLAHELRNPLAPLQSAAEILKAPAATAEQRSEAQRVIGRQIENMKRMIDDLLDVSRITQGKIVLRQDPVELQAILTAAVKIAQQTCEYHGQTLTISLPHEAIYINGDPTRLDQVFGNLLGNACKYSGSGSHIRLTAELLTQDEVTIRVADDGIGIDPELLPTIFELFVQSSRTLDRSHGGLGIGLTIVHRLVTMHGGTVEVHSAGLGQGCEFIVRLPVIRPPAILLKPSKAVAPPMASCRMLIVDDNLDAAESMAMLQTLYGHETRTAHSGSQALQILADFRPQVVLLDIGLPEMDGFEIARRIRLMPEHGKTFLVAISGYSTEQDRKRSKAAGFDEHLAKPPDFHLLNEWLRTRL